MKDPNVYYGQLQKDCEEMVLKAGELLRSLQVKLTIVKMKDDIDLSTSSDIASEQLLISTIKQKYPDHSILSEEQGFIDRKSDYLWIIDPLDGSKEYAKGLKTYNVLLAVEHQQKLVASAIYTHGPQELYACSRGNGAYLDGNTIKASQTVDIEKSLVGFHLPISTAPRASIERSLNILRGLVYATYRVRPTWYDANFFGWVARGAIDAHIVPPDTHNDWDDDAAGLLLVEESGGTITDYDGKEIQNHDLSNGIVASNGKIHDSLLTLIKKSTL
jgi:myo-inositol-1(or 4)-monophosphatase